eukprot:CAMPEP_0196750260 /NCGR_PEP_ID=MMETSP1091-20130531/79997_1 /TAXON_ID=302021 /ORGANISM="Rhodomonas sp., Strain CCMP768" /LENGTH=164 /DNA_ID=CAMNT_0042097859 /DNA_START=205 /DNA_END=700 /DNA_ORIENTATION=-
MKKDGEGVNEGEFFQGWKNHDSGWQKHDDIDLEAGEIGEKASLLQQNRHDGREGQENGKKSHRKFKSAQKVPGGREFEMRRVTWADDDHGDDLEEEFIIPSRPLLQRRASEAPLPLAVLAALLFLLFLLWVTSHATTDSTLSPHLPPAVGHSGAIITVTVHHET